MATRVGEASKEGRQFILDMLSGTIHGLCYPFAIALNRGLGWPIVGMVTRLGIIHVGVRAPNGMIWDGRGEISEVDFVKPFITDAAYSIEYVFESRLQENGPVKEHEIKVFLEKAQCVWPELPWKNISEQEKIIAFANELEALSRKHKLWICAATPMNLPVIFKGDGSEAGYEIALTPDSNAYTIKRVLEREVE